MNHLSTVVHVSSLFTLREQRDKLNVKGDAWPKGKYTQNANYSVTWTGLFTRLREQRAWKGMLLQSNLSGGRTVGPML